MWDNSEHMQAPDSLRVHQLRAVEALRQVDEICRNHGITYFLIAGSALGAVRHHGFIPWDDDIDIGMRIPDYDRFRQVMREHNLSSPYVWRHIDVDETFMRMTGHIAYDGVSVMTVFPIVRRSDNWFGQKRQWIMKKYYPTIYHRMLGWRNPRHKTFGRKVNYIISSCVAHFYTRESALDLVRKNERRYEAKETEYYINLYSKYSLDKESIKAVWVKNLILLPFEGEKYPVFYAYHDYLKHLYGDYDQLPPVAERVSAHVTSYQ